MTQPPQRVKKVAAATFLRKRNAVCTYSTAHTDLVRSEADSAVDRPLPSFYTVPK